MARAIAATLQVDPYKTCSNTLESWPWRTHAAAVSGEKAETKHAHQRLKSCLEHDFEVRKLASGHH